MSDFEENEKRYEIMAEQERCTAHDCIGDAENCDNVHPNIAKNVIAPIPMICKPEPHPKNWRKWFQTPKTILWYTNQHNLKIQAFNLTEAFNQMTSSAKLNVISGIFHNLLSDDEKSLFLSAVMGPKQ